MEDDVIPRIKEPVKGMSFFNNAPPSEPYASFQRFKYVEDHFTHTKGYERAIHSLIAEARRRKRDNLYVDTVIFPLLFLIRHHIELYLKEILHLNCLIKNQTWEWKETHSLNELWVRCKAVFQNKSGFSWQYLEMIEKPICELERKFGDSQNEIGRYLFSKRWRNSKETEARKKYAENFPDQVNYDNILDVFERLNTALLGMIGCLEAEDEANREMESY